MPMRPFLLAACLSAVAALPATAAPMLSQGTITWQGCAAGYPADIAFEPTSKPGRVELLHDGESGTIDVGADGMIGKDTMAGKPGKPGTVTVSGTIFKGTVQRGACTGSFTAK
jgi:hypothetical protein